MVKMSVENIDSIICELTTPPYKTIMDQQIAIALKETPEINIPIVIEVIKQMVRDEDYI